MENNIQYYATVIKDAQFEQQDPAVLKEISDFLFRLDWLVKHNVFSINEDASSNFLENIKKD